MNTIAVNTRSLRVSVAFDLVDLVSGRRPLSEVRVRVAGVDQVATVKDSGYVLFLDLPESEYEVLIEARDYALQDPVFFNPAALDLTQATVPLNLAPRVSYPFDPDATTLFATIVDEQGMGVPGAKVEVVGGLFGETFARTDVSGRCALFFDEADESRVLNLIVSKDSYVNKSVAITIFRGQQVSFVSELEQLAGANLAVLIGRVVDVANLVVTQAQVSVSPWGVSAQTDWDGRFFLEQSVTADESVTLNISQDGFADQSQAVTAVKGEVVDTPVVMNLDVLPDTACFGVEITTDGGFVQGALVEVIEKSRAALSNADGLTRFYFNDLTVDSETVTLRVSKTGYTTKTVTRTVRRGLSVRRSVNIKPE
ncbi:MAG: hypothetical protein NXI24_00720 [bacterium]|nr:hypothetical protein [bacterium]